MPSVPYATARRIARFRDQRWLVDAVVKLIGPEFDQSRLHYLAAPMNPDYQGTVMGVQRW